MPKHDPTAAEMYASNKADAWVYDVYGQRPFTRTGIEAVIRSAFADGAASAMSKGTLTVKQREAVLDVLNERIAGGVDDLRDALGLSKREAGDMMRILERVTNKLMGPGASDES